MLHWQYGPLIFFKNGSRSIFQKNGPFVQILGILDHLFNTILRTEIVLVIAFRDDDDSS